MLTHGFEKDRLKILFEKFFIIFIFMQPLLDITVYMGIQISNLIRVLALFIGLLYLYIYPDKKIKWQSIGYIVTLGIFMLLHTINNFTLKDPYFFSEELTYAIKSIYIVAMLVIYSAVFRSYKRNADWSQLIQKGITFNIIFIGLVMVLASLTDSGKRSYSMLAKSGHSGWFFSANEISAILAMGFGIMLLYIIGKREISKKIIFLPFVFIAGWSMLTVGTKVAFLALIVLLSVGLILSLFEVIFKRKSGFNLLIIVSLLAVTLIYLPYSDVGNNLSITFSEPSAPSNDNIQTPNDETNQNNDMPKENYAEHDKGNFSSEFIKKALSGRDSFFTTILEDYKESPLSQKLLGMGPGGNYESKLKLIEMDFLDWFFSFGIIGFSLLIMPILLLGFMVIRNLIQFRFRQMNSEFFMVSIEVGLAIGVSIFAGHIFLNPASGIYFSILLSYLFVLSTNKDKHVEDNPKEIL